MLPDIENNHSTEELNPEASRSSDMMTDELIPSASSSERINNVVEKNEKSQNQKQSQFELGREYEVCIAMLFISKALFKKYSFKVGVEVEEARKFDDLFFLREENNEMMTRCLQIKHTSKQKKILSNGLLTCQDSPFSIVKYFFSFKDMAEEDIFKEFIQEDLIVYTNYSLDKNSGISSDLIMSKEWKELEKNDINFDTKKLHELLNSNIGHPDSILDVKMINDRVEMGSKIEKQNLKKEKPCRYKFNNKLVRILKVNANEYNVTRLAQALINWLLDKKVLEQVEYIIKPYWKFLKDQVINTEIKQFRKSFVENSNVNRSKEAEFFHKKMIEEIKRKNDKKVNKKIQEIKRKNYPSIKMRQKINDQIVQNLKIIEKIEFKLNQNNKMIHQITNQIHHTTIIIDEIKRKNEENNKMILELDQNIKMKHESDCKNDLNNKATEEISRKVDQMFKINISHEIDQYRKMIQEYEYEIDQNIRINKEIELNNHRNIKWRHKILRKNNESTNMIKDIEHEIKHNNNGMFNPLKEDDLISIEYLNEKLQITNEYPTWELPEGHFTINEVIKDEEITTFLELLVLAVNQPNITELKAAIKYDILKHLREKYGDDDFHKEDIERYAKEIIEYFQSEVTKWTEGENYRRKRNKKEIKYITETNSQQFFELKSVKFNVQNPVKSFTGRDNEIENLRSIICKGKTMKEQTIVICGPPGIGKSELVRGYIQKYSCRHENTIIWIDAMTQDSIEDSFRRLAKILEIDMKTNEDKLKNIDQIVMEVYETFQPKKLLYIFDDVSNQETISPYMSRVSNLNKNFPFLIITSRDDSSWKNYKKIELKAFTTEKAIQLFQKQISIKEIKETLQLKQFVNSLELHPLAVHQMAVYIEKEQQKETQLTVAQCIKRTSDEILDIELPNSNSPCEKVMYANLKNVIDGIPKTERDAEKIIVMLGMMSSMASNKVKTNWFQNSFEINFYEILQLLEDYAIIRIDSGVMSIHNLEQLVTSLLTKRRNLEEVLHTTTYQFLKDIHVNFATDYNTKRILTSHLEAYISYVGEDNAFCSIDKKIPMNEDLLLMLGDCSLEVNAYEKGRSAYKRLYEIRKDIYGEDHTETAGALLGLANAEFHLGNYVVAKSYYQRVYEIYKKNSGEDDEETARPLMGLADVEFNIGNHSIAKSHYECVYAVYIAYLGEDHPETIVPLKGLANVEFHLGNYDIAKSFYRQVYSLYKKNHGEDHTKMAGALKDLADTEYKLQNYDIAKSFYQQVYSMYKTNHGQDYIETARSLKCWADSEYNLRNYDIAKSFYQQVYSLYKANLGVDNIETAGALMCLANTEYKLQNYDIAKTFYQQVHSMYKTNHGEEMAEALQGLADSEYNLENYDMAKSLYQQVYSMYKTNYGDDHIETARALKGLANTEYNIGNYDIAKSFYQEVYSLYKTNHGKGHIKTAGALKCWAHSEYNLRNYDIAKSFYKQVYSIYKRIHGEGHIETAEALKCWADSEYNLRNCDIAKSLYQQVYSMYKTNHGKDHIETARALKRWADSEYSLRNYDIAKSFYQQVYSMYKTNYGEGNIETAGALKCWANSEFDLRNYDIAKSFYQQVYSLYKANHGEGHIETAGALKCLADSEYNLRNYDNAKSFFQRVYSIYQKNHGKGHIETAGALNCWAHSEYNLRNYDIAKSFYKQVYSIYKRIHGEGHTETAEALKCWADSEYNLRNYDIAKSFYQRVYSLYKANHGKGDIETARALKCWADSEYNLRNNDIAKSFYQQVYSIYQTNYGEYHIEMAGALKDLAKIEFCLENYDIAKSFYQQVYSIHKTNYGEDHIETAEALHHLAHTEFNLGNYDIAKSFYQQVYSMYKTNYGKDHIKTARVLNDLADTEYNLR
ncbi:uncharacterized protein LOC143920585 [Arctopsyche grandis]|uniref:uncharacterized protein LOC143920585 n=1 Tax=Arctopsyche grandis TaxID=121162 RepID=UPI00406D9C3B